MQFEGGVTFIDDLVMERRRRYEKNNKGKTAAYPRVRGQKKDTPLPSMGPTDEKIKRGTIDAKWLAAHSDQDTPSRIDYHYDSPSPADEQSEN
jgi:hypothetical protein